MVLAVGNKTSWLQKSSKYINRLEGLVSFSCVRNLIYKNTCFQPQFESFEFEFSTGFDVSTVSIESGSSVHRGVDEVRLCYIHTVIKGFVICFSKCQQYPVPEPPEPFQNLWKVKIVCDISEYKKAPLKSRFWMSFIRHVYVLHISERVFPGLSRSDA